VFPLKKHYGHRIRLLHWGADQNVTNALAQMELTASQGRIMGYLAHRQEAPCSRDIEEAFHMSHPTVSGLLSRLEKKGFIEFRPDEQDRRCKRIYILDKGWKCNELMYQTIMDNEKRMVQGFTEQEQELFSDFLERAIANMGVGSCHRKHKEEP
jgi:DNA-binding MarR family transcriptional regulator